MISLVFALSLSGLCLGQDSTISTDTKCALKCAEWYDGCNVYKCNDDGTVTQTTDAWCSTYSSETYCTQLKEGTSADTSVTCSANCAIYYDGCNDCRCDVDTMTSVYCTQNSCTSRGTPTCKKEKDYTYLQSGKCPTDCVTYYDGCNTCTCSNGATSDCTQRLCIWRGEPECLQTATTDLRCPDKCAVYYDGCNTHKCSEAGVIMSSTDVQCIRQGEAKCTEYYGSSTDTTSSTTSTTTKEGDTTRSSTSDDSSSGSSTGDECPDDNCYVWYDGCNTCKCEYNADTGKNTMTCTELACVTSGDAYCKRCKYGMEWQSCGSPCDATCSNYNDLVCTGVCEEKCACPPDRPVLSSDTTPVCIPKDNCDGSTSVRVSWWGVIRVEFTDESLKETICEYNWRESCYAKLFSDASKIQLNICDGFSATGEEVIEKYRDNDYKVVDDGSDDSGSSSTTDDTDPYSKGTRRRRMQDGSVSNTDSSSSNTDGTTTTYQDDTTSIYIEVFMYWTSIDGFNNAADTFTTLAARIQENGPSDITVDVLESKLSCFGDDTTCTAAQTTVDDLTGSNSSDGRGSSDSHRVSIHPIFLFAVSLIPLFY